MRMRNKGLVFPLTRVEIEPVKSAHKRKCDRCGDLPGISRLKVVRGAGRSSTTEVFCRADGRRFLVDLLDGVERALTKLGDDSLDTARVEIAPKGGKEIDYHDDKELAVTVPEGEAVEAYCAGFFAGLRQRKGAVPYRQHGTQYESYSRGYAAGRKMEQGQ